MHCCAICGRETRFDEGEVDHIKPKSKGRSDLPRNLQ
ncbi:TPA: HNH endonuclease [Candidatus Bathyarchaeota archaeon]|nr:HNH endonuclease [Candidatus Bathyarchaeota archaeon]